MSLLCQYSCSYCGRSIETSFVTLGKKHYHALENDIGDRGGPSCYTLSEHGTQTLDQRFVAGPDAPTTEAEQFALQG
jgi:hypothetical protein